MFVCYLELTDEQREMQRVARKFTQDEIIPKATHHDQTGEVSDLFQSVTVMSWSLHYTQDRLQQRHLKCNLTK